MNILSWNVNGIRSVLKSGFREWFADAQPDILCLQESRAMPDDIDEADRVPKGYVSYWNPAQKKGYSGTATFVKSKYAPLSVGNIGLPEFDNEGRVQVLEFKDFTILNAYWPNSQDQRTRIGYKLSFVEAMTNHASALVKQGKHVILCGDFNIAHTEIDLARPKDNENSPGYYIEEREAMAKLLSAGYADTFRHHNKEPGHYSWWSYRTRARDRNIGWRIDYHCVNNDFLPRVKRAWIANDVFGSDHCPVGIEIKK